MTHQTLALKISFHSTDLDKGEGRSGAERLGFMRHLILDVLLHALLLEDLLLLIHVEEDSGRHSDGDRVLWLGLEGRRFNTRHFKLDLIFLFNYLNLC